MEHLHNSHKEQTTKSDNMRVYQELKLKDLTQKINSITDTIDNKLIERKEFDELCVTTLGLQQRVDDDMDLVTKNVREARDRMGEMTMKVQTALTSKINLQTNLPDGKRNPLLE